MSKPDWCAQEAKRVYHSLENSHVFNEIAIARALMEAHQRGRREGMEEAAKVAEIFHEDDDRMDRKIKSDVANAIRAKAQEAAKEGE